MTEPRSVRHADAAEAARLMTEAPVAILDVRTPGEYAQGRLAGAVNLDFQRRDFRARLGDMDRTRTYLVVCRSGNRSERALDLFRELGFESVVHLDGGMLAWEKAGQPVTR